MDPQHALYKQVPQGREAQEGDQVEQTEGYVLSESVLASLENVDDDVETFAEVGAPEYGLGVSIDVGNISFDSEISRASTVPENLTKGVVPDFALVHVVDRRRTPPQGPKHD